jgi:hypothetical protein
MEPNATTGNETSETQSPSSAAADAASKASVELFELCAALLLGLGATMGTIAGYQGGLWSGKSIESFGLSSRITTKSADAGTFADSKIASDNLVKLQVIQLVTQAKHTPKGDEREFLLHQISELMIREYSDEAYDAMGLPQEPRKKYDADGDLLDLPEDVIFEASKQNFNKDYFQWMYEEKVKHTVKAEELFAEGQHAGTVGDEFALNGVYYTLSLFFAGLGLVFKSRVRWGFFALGAIIFLGALVYMCRLEWA